MYLRLYSKPQSIEGCWRVWNKMGGANKVTRAPKFSFSTPTAVRARLRFVVIGPKRISMSGLFFKYKACNVAVGTCVGIILPFACVSVCVCVFVRVQLMCVSLCMRVCMCSAVVFYHWYDTIFHTYSGRRCEAVHKIGQAQPNTFAYKCAKVIARQHTHVGLFVLYRSIWPAQNILEKKCHHVHKRRSYLHNGADEHGIVDLNSIEKGVFVKRTNLFFLICVIYCVFTKCLCLFIYVCVYMCVCVYAYENKCICTYTHTNTSEYMFVYDVSINNYTCTHVLTHLC